MRKGRTSRILLTHTPEMFRNYYGERALARLREQGEVRLHSGEHPLAGEALVMRARAADPHVRVPAGEGVEQVDLPGLLAAADYVVCLATATPETENLMNDAAFAGMKPGAFFVNVSRGNLVDEAALARALDSGRLAGCAIDVGRAEVQMPNPAIAARPDVIATPHLGGLTPQAIEHQAFETVAQVAEIVHGRAPKGAVNAQHATRLARFAMKSPRREA